MKNKELNTLLEKYAEENKWVGFFEERNSKQDIAYKNERILKAEKLKDKIIGLFNNRQLDLWELCKKNNT